MRTFKFGKHKYYFHLSEYTDGGTRLELCEKGDLQSVALLSELITNENGENIFSKEPDKICLNPDLTPEFFMYLQWQGFMTNTGETEIDIGVIHHIMKLDLNKIREYSCYGL